MRGTARLGTRTKALVDRLQVGDIAIIRHADLDEVAADALRRARVAAVINGAPSITGRYPNLGPSLLVAAGVPLLDADAKVMECIADGDEITVDTAGVVHGPDGVVTAGTWLTEDVVAQRLEAARRNLPAEVERFIDNTLLHAQREKSFVTRPLAWPKFRVCLRGRHALVVVRGHRHRDDLAMLLSYIAAERPVLIGVDGGADALREAGFKADIIVGDMDSVSDEALREAMEIVVHGYPDGRAPGHARTARLGLAAHVMPAPGTSEDVALLLAYEHGATLIVAVGTHSNPIDFLEKGRAGMASTFLVRLKVGSHLVDARGVSELYRPRPRWRHPVQIALAAMVPVIIVVFVGGSLRQLLHLAWLQLRVLVGW